MTPVRLGQEEKLPWEMIEEILSRVPPKSLVCFRIVSKKWNNLFQDKTFLNNHKSTFRFVLRTKSKFYSVSINPEVVVRELTLDIPGLGTQILEKFVDCNELLLYYMRKGVVVWNPWLKHTRVIVPEVSRPHLRFNGIGYDGRGEKYVYKLLASYWLGTQSGWKIHDLATNAWKDQHQSESTTQGGKRPTSYTSKAVSLNGNLYWIAFYDRTAPLYHIVQFDFFTENFLLYCDLPCLKTHPRDSLVLGNFNGDRLSLLKQCHVTKKIEVWVTKNKINNDHDVVWMTFMEVSIPNLPELLRTRSYSQPSYLIDGKRLVVCCCDETGQAWIYVMGGNKLISKTRIESVTDCWPLHCMCFPSLVPVS